MKDFLNRFETIPDVLELDHLTVSGDVTFGKGVCLKVGLICLVGEPLTKLSVVRKLQGNWQSEVLLLYRKKLLYT